MQNEIEAIKLEIDSIKTRLSVLEERLVLLQKQQQDSKPDVLPTINPTDTKMSHELIIKTMERLASDLLEKLVVILPNLRMNKKKQKPRLNCVYYNEKATLCWFNEEAGKIKFLYRTTKPNDSIGFVPKNVEEIFINWQTNVDALVELVKPIAIFFAQPIPKKAVVVDNPIRVHPFCRIESVDNMPTGTKPLDVYLPVINRNGVTVYPLRVIHAFESPKKKVYYINLDDIDKLTLYGHPALYMPAETIKGGKSSGFGSNLAAESPLMRCGYNVDAKKALSSNQRHEILRYAKEEGYSDREDIIRFIEWLIRTRWNMKNMANAISKWQEDLIYVKANLR